MGGLMKSLLALMLMLATMAQAQQWPSKPVKLVKCIITDRKSVV